MNIYEFMSGSPWLSFFLACLILLFATRLVFLCWNRLLRHLNIRKAGWPPAHLDADGDFLLVRKVKS